MGPLIIRLLTIINSENIKSTNYHIAMTLLQHYNLISVSSISDIAQLCNVSKSTISKFARYIGFDDYFDLKDAAPFVENKYNFDLNYISNILESIDKYGHDYYFQSIIKDTQSLKDQIDMNAINQLAKDILQYETIGAFGLLFSESAAIDFQYKLAYNGKFILTFQNDLKQVDFIENASEDTLIIVFSNSGSFLERQQLKKNISHRNIFKDSKAKIVVITSNPAVKKFSFVSEVILFPHETEIQTHSFMYPIITDLIVSRYRYYKKNNQ